VNPVLDVRSLEVVYQTQVSSLQALHDVSFVVQPGEIVGIVGESGCGKSTVGSAVMRLLPPNGAISSGEILFQGRDLRQMPADELRGLRGREMAMIFQDPMTCLNPVFTIRSQMFDILRTQQGTTRLNKKEIERLAFQSLDEVGIPDVAKRIDDYPHQFSGGMRQRILIAMALVTRPALLVADEPTSALDVTLEAQIIDLIRELRQAHQTSVLFITHDLGVIAQLCDRVIVMYAGRVVEQQETLALFDNPRHPYTRALLAAVPSRVHRGEPLATIPGRVPSLTSLPEGCKFSDRCSLIQEICLQA